MNEDIEQKVIVALGLLGKSDAEIEDVIGELGGYILEDVLIKVTDTLPDDKVITFERLIEAGNGDRIQAFIVENVKNLDQIVEEASKSVIEEYKNA